VPRLTFLLAATAATTALALATAAAAPALAATPVSDAVAGLRADHLYVDPAATTKLDQAAVRAAIGDEPIRIAIMAAGAGVSTVRQWPRMIADQLPGNTIATIAGRYFYAGSDVLAAGAAGLAATHAIAKHKDVLRENTSSDITAALLDFVAEVKAAPKAPVSRDDRDSRYADTPGGGTTTGDPADNSQDTSVLPWLIGAAALAALAAVGGVLEVRRRAGSRSRGLHTQTYDLLRRLGGELPGDTGAGDTGNATGAAAAAYADAAARHGTGQALLTAASTDAQVAAARHVILEGLVAARHARALLGTAPGAAIPPFDPPAPKVRRDSAEPVAVGAATLSPDPQYAPDTPYFHAGGYGLAAGWYPVRIPDTGAFEMPENLPTEPTGTSHGTR
jgi:hypothetical protein